MPRTDIILTHETALPKAPYVGIIAKHWADNHFGPLPPSDDVRGSVNAEVNQGRWLINCPAQCGGAIYASTETPLFLCPECGSSENGGKWYAVRWPEDRGAIEKELLVRPARTAAQIATRNWLPGETVLDLRRENAQHGVGG